MKQQDDEFSIIDKVYSCHNDLPEIKHECIFKKRKTMVLKI